MENGKKPVSMEVLLSPVHMKALELIAADNGETVKKAASDMLSAVIEEQFKRQLDEIFENATEELEEEVWQSQGP